MFGDFPENFDRHTSNIFKIFVFGVQPVQPVDATSATSGCNQCDQWMQPVRPVGATSENFRFFASDFGRRTMSTLQKKLKPCRISIVGMPRYSVFYLTRSDLANICRGNFFPAYLGVTRATSGRNQCNQWVQPVNFSFFPHQISVG